MLADQPWTKAQPFIGLNVYHAFVAYVPGNMVIPLMRQCALLNIAHFRFLSPDSHLHRAEAAHICGRHTDTLLIVAVLGGRGTFAGCPCLLQNAIF